VQRWCSFPVLPHLHPPKASTTLSGHHRRREMHRVVQDHAGRCQIIIMAAAVSDFRPKEPSDRKLKKEGASLAITLERTEDILQGLGEARQGRILVGFAAETDDLIRTPETSSRKRTSTLSLQTRSGCREVVSHQT